MSRNIVDQVNCTRRFWQNWHKLPEALRRRARGKIALLQSNPAHPSLRVHQLHRTAVQTCAISGKFRLLFERKTGGLLLLDVGSHRSVDRAHVHLRSPSGQSRRRKKQPRSAPLSASSKRSQQKKRRRIVHRRVQGKRHRFAP